MVCGFWKKKAVFPAAWILQVLLNHSFTSFNVASNPLRTTRLVVFVGGYYGTLYTVRLYPS